MKETIFFRISAWTTFFFSCYTWWLLYNQGTGWWIGLGVILLITLLTLIMGPNGTIALTKYQFNGDATLFGNVLESVGTPTKSDHCATKGYVDIAIGNISGGESGPVSQLENENGKSGNNWFWYYRCRCC